jgi:hypothetical protein
LLQAIVRVACGGGLLAMAGMVVRAQGPVVVLYQGTLAVPASTLTQESWQPSSSDFTSNYFSAGDGVTLLDTRYSTPLFAGWSTHGLITGNQIHPAAPVLDVLTGFSVRFQLAVDEEQHDTAPDLNGDGLADDAGFALAVLASDQRGVRLNWWQDRIWASDDDTAGGTLLAQAEGVAQDPVRNSQLRDYTLTMFREAWRLSVDGGMILEGRRRDYRNHPGLRVNAAITLNALNKANIIAPGDPSTEASAVVRLGPIAVESFFVPEAAAIPVPLREEGQFRLGWSSIPGRHYRVEWSDDLLGWEADEPVEATRFFTRSRPAFIPGKLYVRVKTLPP